MPKGHGGPPLPFLLRPSPLFLSPLSPSPLSLSPPSRPLLCPISPLLFPPLP